MLIETKRLTLRAVEPEDAGFLAGLFNEAGTADPDAPRELIYPVSEEMELEWIASLPRRTADAHMIIEKRKGGAALGIISVDEMDWRNASARLRVRVTRENWENGYGAEAVGATVEFLFDRMNFRRVWLRVDEGNSRAIRSFEQCGFVLEGVLREDHVRDGGWKNSLLMSMLRSDQRGAGHD